MVFNRFVLFAATTFSCVGACAQNSVADCASALVYDTAEMAGNYASKLAVWETVDKESFESAQKKAGGTAQIYGIPVTMTWEQFNDERSRIRESMSLQQDISYSTTSKWQAVSQNSKDAYIACINAISNKKFIATLLFATRETVAIYVRKVEDAGPSRKDKVKVIFTDGGRPSRREATMNGNSSTTISFTREPGKPFTASLVLFSPEGDDIDSADFTLPKYTHIKNRPIPKELFSNIVECQHTHYGGAAGIMKVTAAPNEVLLPDRWNPITVLRAGAGPGSARVNVTSTNSRFMVAEGGCSSQSSDTSALWNLSFKVAAMQDHFVDDDLKAVTASALRTATAKNRGAGK